MNIRSNTGGHDPVDDTLKPHCTIEKLKSAEIVFKSCLENKWIYTVKELGELLASSHLCSVEELKRMNLICRHVINADAQNIDFFADGVVELFKKYYHSRHAALLLSKDALGLTLTTEPMKIVHSYLDSDEQLVAKVNSHR